MEALSLIVSLVWGVLGVGYLTMKFWPKKPIKE